MCDTQVTLSKTIFKLAVVLSSLVRTDYVERELLKVVFLAILKSCLDFVEC